MNIKTKIDQRTIRFDYSRSVPKDVASEGVVLLYDEYNGCYYETTVNHLLSKVMAELDSAREKLSEELRKRAEAVYKQEAEFIRKSKDQQLEFVRSSKAEQSEFVRSAKEEQAKFIKDMSEVNRKLIELVEASKK